MFDAEDLIRQAIKRHGDSIAVAWSYGRASTIVTHMAIKYKPDIKVFFNNTKCQPIEVLKYGRELGLDWNVNLIELFPEPGITFWTLADKYGLPTTRKSGGKGSNAPKCCYYLKEKPAFKAYEEHKITSLLTGIMAEESSNRKLLSLRYENKGLYHDGIEMCGQRYYASTQNLWKYHPIMYWGKEDLLEYNKDNNIPTCEFYTKWGGLYERSGCLTCTAYLDWEKKLSKSHPTLYRKLKRMQDQEQKTIEEFK